MKERNSNIELLRIFAMMGVVALHYVNGSIGGIEKYAVFPGFVWIFCTCVKSMAVPLVNVFVIITGYYLSCSKAFSFRKIVNLLVIVIFYGAFLYLMICAMTSSEFSVVGLVRSAFPFFFDSAWFIKTYIILLLIAPYLNRALSGLSVSGYRRLLAIQVILFSVWYSVGLSSPLADDGYGIINFLTLYIIGGYFRRFMEESSRITGLSSNRAFLLYLCCSLLTAVLSIFINPFGYAFISNVAGAAMLFLAVIKKRRKSHKLINILAGNAFDVFFVHTKCFPLLRVGSITGGFLLIPHFVLTVCSCYLIGFLCGYFRKELIRRTIDRLLNKSVAINRTYSE